MRMQHNFLFVYFPVESSFIVAISPTYAQYVFVSKNADSFIYLHNGNAERFRILTLNHIRLQIVYLFVFGY